ARLLSTPASEYSRTTRVLAKAGSAVIAIALGSLCIVLVSASWLESMADLSLVPARPLVSLCGLGCAAIVGFACVRLRSHRLAVSLGAVATVTMGFVYLVAIPAAEPYRWQRPFAAEVTERTGGKLALYRTREMVYYLNSPHALPEYE